MNQIPIKKFAAALATHKNNQRVGFIDVRTVEEYKVCHIDGVQNIPLHELEDRQNELQSFTTIYVHCRSGNRSAKALDLLANFNGEMFNFSGGMNAWKAQNHPVVEEKESVWRQWIDWIFGK